VDGVYVKFNNKAIFTFKNFNLNKYNLKDLNIKNILILTLNKNGELIFN